jgi:hypothetical protein
MRYEHEEAPLTSSVTLWNVSNMQWAFVLSLGLCNSHMHTTERQGPMRYEYFLAHAHLPESVTLWGMRQACVHSTQERKLPLQHAHTDAYGTLLHMLHIAISSRRSGKAS